MTSTLDPLACELLRWAYALSLARRSGMLLDVLLVALTVAFVVAGWRLVAAAVRQLPRPTPRRSRA